MMNQSIISRKFIIKPKASWTKMSVIYRCSCLSMSKLMSVYTQNLDFGSEAKGTNDPGHRELVNGHKYE